MRIVEILVGLNALLGIGTYLGVKFTARRIHEKAHGLIDRGDDSPV